jgi:hypothetical protein
VNLNPLRWSQAAGAAPSRVAAPKGSGQADQISSQRRRDAGTGHSGACNSPDSRAATPPGITGQPSSGATGEVDLRYVLRSRVDEYVNVSSRFQIWLAITLAFVGGDLAALAALAAGAQHPFVLYLMLCGLTCFSVAFAVMTVLDGLRMRAARTQLDMSTRSDLPLSVTVTANASSTPRIGGQSEDQ